MRLLTLISLTALSSLAAADLPARWVGVMKLAIGPTADVYLTLQLEGNAISGTLAYQDQTQTVPLENAALRGDQLTFEIHDNPNRAVSFRLTLGDSALNGEARSADRVADVRMSPVGLQGVFRVGGGIRAPVLLSKVEPEFSEEARATEAQGTVTLYVQVNPSGRTVNIRVLHALGFGLDEKAIEAVKQWKFRPGMKNGEAVTVEAQIEVNFRRETR